MKNLNKQITAALSSMLKETAAGGDDANGISLLLEDLTAIQAGIGLKEEGSGASFKGTKLTNVLSVLVRRGWTIDSSAFGTLTFGQIGITSPDADRIILSPSGAKYVALAAK